MIHISGSSFSIFENLNYIDHARKKYRDISMGYFE